MNNPLVSVITPAFNSEAFVSDTIQSVKNQTLKNWELIVVDDASQDQTWEKIQQAVASDERIVGIRLKENSGAAVARNTAIKAAKGRYIAFLDSDDLWFSEKLMRQIAFMEKSGTPFSFTAYQKMSENGEHQGSMGVPYRVDYKSLLLSCSVGCLTAVYDTKYLGKLYMPLIRKRQDYALWLLILKKTQYGYGLNEVLAKYRLTPDSLSSSKRNAAAYQWQVYREIEKIPTVRALYFFSQYALRGLARTRTPNLARLCGWLQTPKAKR